MGDPTNTTVFDVELSGCRPEPLASYLKAIGVLRLVAEQVDSDARGCWSGEYFVVRSTLDRDALVRFFVEAWRPTPIVAPWNGGSGFWPSTSDTALRSIESSQATRLADYAKAIAVARNAIAHLKLAEAPEKGAPKTRLLTYLRANTSDEALAWLDAAAVLTDDEPIYPALLGTGGNDGRQDFSNNFMQRVLAVLDEPHGIQSSLLGVPAPIGTKGSMGQFSPTALDRSNPWDFVLAIEGSLVLAGAATRRLETSQGSSLAFPFHARAADAPSLADGEEGHGELWLPRWTTFSDYRDVRRLFAEGRAKTRAGAAATGVDFARSISGLGVDRGLSEFVRFSFKQRNGKNYFATALGRFGTREIGAARLLDDLDAWFDGFRRKASGNNVPEGVRIARRRIEQAMFEAVTTGALSSVLLELGDVQRALVQSLSFTTKAFLRPIPALPATWAAAVANDSTEQRLAAALASRAGIRQRLVPLDETGRAFGRADQARCVFTQRPLVENLLALLLREEVEARQQDCGPGKEAQYAGCSLTDIARFIQGGTDDALIERWLRALVLIDGGLQPAIPAESCAPPATFAVLALVYNRHLGDDTLPHTAGVLARACAGDALGATALAIRRLNASGRPLPLAQLVEPAARTRRIAAALAFPLTSKHRRTLERLVLSAAKEDHLAGGQERL